MTNLNVVLPADEPALLVHAYLDGELDPANALMVGRQIAADPRLAAELAQTKALREALRDRLPRKTLPPHLLSRVEAAVGLKRPPQRLSWHALAAAAVFAMALGSGSTWFVLHQPASDRIAEAIVDGHIRGLMASPTDVTSSERHTVKPWFNGRIPEAPRVVDLAGEGFPLIGARVDVIGAAPVATLVYGRRKHIISLSAVPDASSGEGAPVPSSTKGYNLVSWRENGISYWAISDLAIGELQAFVRLFKTA
jgi:anti-sigma factor RsiW